MSQCDGGAGIGAGAGSRTMLNIPSEPSLSATDTHQ